MIPRKRRSEPLWGPELWNGMQGVCSVALPDTHSVSVSVVRRRWGWVGWRFKETKKVARFTYVDRVVRPVVTYSFLDLAQLVRTSAKGGAQVRVTLALLSGEKRVAKLEPNTFMRQLKQSSSNMSFSLHVDREKVTLLKAHRPLSEATAVWPFDVIKPAAPPKRQRYRMYIDPGLEPGAQDPGNAEQQKDSDEESRWEARDEGKHKETEEKSYEADGDTADDESRWEARDEGKHEDTEEKSDEADGDTADDDSGWEADTEGADEEDESGESSDGSGWETLEEDAEQGAGRGPAGSPGKAGGGFLERLGVAWQYARPALLMLGSAAIMATAIWWSPIGRED